MRDLDHIFLTRFNLPSGGHESLVRAQEGWLQQRVELFEKYCLPSVLTQTSSNFHWIVYFDPQSPDWLRQRISEWRRNSVLTPIYRATVVRSEMHGDILGAIGQRGGDLLTTNLDNDDGLASDFVDRLQAAPYSGVRTAIYLANGLIKHESRVFTHEDRCNAFCSVRESWEDPIFCWAAPHNRLQEIMPTQVVSGAPAWLQVVHSRNVSNRVHGKLTSPALYRESFPGLLDEARTPSTLDKVFDAAAARPARMVREAVRRMTKATVHGVFGVEGLDRLKRGWKLAGDRLGRRSHEATKANGR
ncbi:glycosyltransferase [Aliihoeflea sp. 40Bstr573]|uniref:glycosyltransferase n=1 Tax=Aliihoeflea sp. 40Bstr573 TaxID=2696467 RepID=UPI00209465FC|nr:glycosyltransferase [Aliihoeflea sp. 40Bstr573]MCO6388803.1 hypothetical protein [Aliihoeflea sp. 40Bstr573]